MFKRFQCRIVDSAVFNHGNRKLCLVQVVVGDEGWKLSCRITRALSAAGMSHRRTAAFNVIYYRLGDSIGVITDVILDVFRGLAYPVGVDESAVFEVNSVCGRGERTSKHCE